MREAEIIELKAQQAQLIEKNEHLMDKTSYQEKYNTELSHRIANQDQQY